MKKQYIVFLFLLATLQVWGQAPEKMSYQAVLRDADNGLIAKRTVGVQVSILQGKIDGDVVFAELHRPETNENGLMSLEIGTGEEVKGSMTKIEWAKGPYFVKVETDPEGGEKYTISGTTELLSVPYALQAKKASSVDALSSLRVNGNGVVTGDLRVDGKITGDLEIDSIDINKITGLIGQNPTTIFPEIVDNLVDIEISNIDLNNKVIMVSGIGLELERISTATGVDNDGGTIFREQAGPGKEFPLVFETTNEDDANELKQWFDSEEPFPVDIAVVIRDLGDNERGKWLFIGYSPDFYEPGLEGRTRFHLVNNDLPDNKPNINFDGAFGRERLFDPTTDKLVEISGVRIGIAPKVDSIDYEKRTITLTFNFDEAGETFLWIFNTLKGGEPPTDMSVVETPDGTFENETSRRLFFNVIPIRFENIYGFGQDAKMKLQVTIAFGYWQEG